MYNNHYKAVSCLDKKAIFNYKRCNIKINKSTKAGKKWLRKVDKSESHLTK